MGIKYPQKLEDRSPQECVGSPGGAATAWCELLEPDLGPLSEEQLSYPWSHLFRSSSRIVPV